MQANLGTMISADDFIARALVRPWSMREVFESCYLELRALISRATCPGYVVAAVHAGEGLVSAAHLAAAFPGEPSDALVVGRHDHARMRLAEDPTIALRHIAIRVLEGDRCSEARIIDLNTGQGFEIEGAGRFEGARVEGPAFLKIGAYAVMLFTTDGGEEPWPDGSSGLFESLVAARVVEDDDEPAPEIVHFVYGPQKNVATTDRSGRGTVITRVGGPVVPKRAPPTEELPPDTYAVLTAEQARGQTLYPLRGEHLERGVLLGRYERCEIELDGMWANDTASRVHLLLLKEDDTVLAIDTASTNGTLVDGIDVDVVELEDEARIELAEGNVVRWRVVRDQQAVN